MYAPCGHVFHWFHENILKHYQSLSLSPSNLECQIPGGATCLSSLSAIAFRILWGQPLPTVCSVQMANIPGFQLLISPLKVRNGPCCFIHFTASASAFNRSIKFANTGLGHFVQLFFGPCVVACSCNSWTPIWTFPGVAS